MSAGANFDPGVGQRTDPPIRDVQAGRSSRLIERMNTFSTAMPARAQATAVSALAHVPREYPKVSMASKTLLVTGLFNDCETTERAYRCVTERGYFPSEINLLMTEAARRQHFPAKSTNALAAAAAGFGRPVSLPGLSLVIAGPLAAALAGANASTTTAGLSATLLGWNIPEMRVRGYEAALRQGKVLMAVKPRTVADANHFEQAWKKDDADLWGRLSE